MPRWAMISHRERATSFIVDTIFKQWHTAHPDWRVIEKAETRTNAAT